MKNVGLISLSLILVIAISCKKDKDIAPEVPPTVEQGESGGDLSDSEHQDSTATDQFGTNQGEDNPSLPDTIFPGDYFPAYPGSNWNYRIIKKHYQFNGFSYEGPLLGIDTTYETSQTDPEYHFLTTYNNKPVTIDSIYVPLLDGEPIAKYRKLAYHNYVWQYYFFRSFLSEEVGYEFTEGYHGSPHSGYLGPHMIIQDKLVDAQGDSLIIVYGNYQASFPNNHTKEIIQHFHKHVGLTLEIDYRAEINDTLIKKELIDYYINN